MIGEWKEQRKEWEERGWGLGMWRGEGEDRLKGCVGGWGHGIHQAPVFGPVVITACDKSGN